MIFATPLTNIVPTFGATGIKQKFPFPSSARSRRSSESS
jgi:hypothetical protein